MSDRAVGALLVLVSSTAFGSMALFGRWAQEDGTGTMALVFLRFALAAVVLVAVLAGRRLPMPPLRTIGAVMALGGVGYVGQATCYFLALEHADASLVALLLYLFPAFVAVLAVVFLRERPTVVTALALTMSVAGTALVVGGGSGRPLGIGLGVAAAVIYSVYIVVGSVVTQGLDPFVISTMVCVAAAGVTGLIVLTLTVGGHGPAFPDTTRAWWSVLGIAILGTVVAILTFFAGLRRLGATHTSVLATIEPVVTVVLAVAFLGETFGGWQLVGGALVLGAVVWLALSQPEPVASAEAPPV